MFSAGASYQRNSPSWLARILGMDVLPKHQKKNDLQQHLAFRFTDLPTELQLLILGSLMPNPTLTISQYENSRWVDADLSAMWTCKDLYEKGRDTLYRRMTLRLTDHDVVDLEKGQRYPSLPARLETVSIELLKSVRNLEIRFRDSFGHKLYVPDYLALSGLDVSVFRSLRKVALLPIRSKHLGRRYETAFITLKDSRREESQDRWDKQAHLQLRRQFERFTRYPQPLIMILERRLAWSFIPHSVMPAPYYAMEGSPGNHVLAKSHLYVSHTKHDIQTGDIVSQRWFEDGEIRQMYWTDTRAGGDWLVSC